MEDLLALADDNMPFPEGRRWDIRRRIGNLLVIDRDAALLNQGGAPRRWRMPVRSP